MRSLTMPKSFALRVAIAVLAALAAPAAVDAVTIYTTLPAAPPVARFCTGCTDGPGRLFTAFVLGRAARLDTVVFAVDTATDVVGAPVEAGVFAAAGGAVGAAIADTVFAPADIVSRVTTAHGSTLVRVALPIDLSAGRYFFSAVGAAQAAIPAYLKHGGILDVIDGSDRRLDNLVTGFALDGTLAVIPEPRVWALLITGYAMIGFAMRRRGWARRVSV